MFFVLCLCFFLSNWNLAKFLCVVVVSGPPNGPTLFGSSESEVEYGFNGRFEFYKNTLGSAGCVLFGILGISEVALAWVRISRNTASLNALSRSLHNYDIRIRVFQGVSLLSMLVANLVDRLTIDGRSTVGIVLFVLAIVMSMGYAFGYVSLVPLLKGLDLGTRRNENTGTWATQFSPLVTSIWVTTVFMIPSLIIFSSSWMAYSIMDSSYVGFDRNPWFGSGSGSTYVVPAAICDLFTTLGLLGCASVGTYFLVSTREKFRKYNATTPRLSPSIQINTSSIPVTE